jgi:hypothetical protein
MTWVSPTAFIAQLRTQLAACAAWTAAVGAGNETARIHFPTANLGGQTGTPDPLPLAVLVQTEESFPRYAEGAGGIVSGQLEVDLYLPATTANTLVAWSVGDVEALASNLVRQLLLQPAVIPFTGAPARAMARDPNSAALARDDAGTPAAFRTITLRLPYGYSP